MPATPAVPRFGLVQKLDRVKELLEIDSSIKGLPSIIKEANRLGVGNEASGKPLPEQVDYILLVLGVDPNELSEMPGP